MPLEETLESFRYFLGEVDKLKVSYVALVRYTTKADMVIDGVFFSGFWSLITILTHRNPSLIRTIPRDAA